MSFEILFFSLSAAHSPPLLKISFLYDLFKLTSLSPFTKPFPELFLRDAPIALCCSAGYSRAYLKRFRILPSVSLYPPRRLHCWATLTASLLTIVAGNICTLVSLSFSLCQFFGHMEEGD